MTLNRLRVIGANTFLEAIRQKVFSFLLLICLATVIGSQFFQQFDFGDSELKFIADFGFGAIFFFGTILAVAATAQLFFSEIENRTALTILAKPIYRWEFIGGKFLGIAGVLAIFCLLMAVLLAGVIFVRESQMIAKRPENFADGRIFNYGNVFLFCFAHWLKFLLISIITIFISSFARTNLYAITVSFFAVVICQLQYIAVNAYESSENAFVGALAWVGAKFFPNFQVYNVGDQLATGSEVPFAIFPNMIGFTLIYLVMFGALSVYTFSKREI